MATVLLVDDVDIVRMVLRRMLVNGGHTVVEADNAAAAKAVLREGRCQIVVTDVWMPGEDGLSLIQEVKTNRPGMPAIAITGGAPRAPTEFSFEAAAKAGADLILFKPVAKEEMLEAVEQLLATAGQNKAR